MKPPLPAAAPPAAGMRRLFWPGVLVLLAFAILVGLGTWQLQRLAWKQAVLARIDARISAAPVALPPQADWASLMPDDYEYRRVALSGTFEHDKEALVFQPEGIGAASGAGPGYLVLTPLRLASGAHVIVDRGFVTLDRERPESRAAGAVGGEVTITGLMRSPEGRNLFTPTDDPARGLWYTRDPGLIAAHFQLDRTAPFSIDADAADVPGGWPKGGQTLVDIPNNHLSYALTWYGLAATLLVVFAIRAFWRRRPAAAAPDPEQLLRG